MPEVGTAALMGMLAGLFAGMGLGWYARGWCRRVDHLTYPDAQPEQPAPRDTKWIDDAFTEAFKR